MRLALVGWFVFSTAAAEKRHGRPGTMLDGIKVRDRRGRIDANWMPAPTSVRNVIGTS